MMTTPRTASELLDAMRGCGFTLSLDGNTLEVKQARWIDDDLAVLIRTHKLGLINILKSEAGNNE